MVDFIFKGYKLSSKIYTYDVLVIGSGAAGFNAANTILKDGRKTVALITENINSGTSRNTGSDKQTYYKLSLAGDMLDSVSLMAKNIFDGGCVDGDNALCEAAQSVSCFMNLCRLGVPFPTNSSGEYVGYKTDHDEHARATSAGPLTSKFMTEALQTEAKNLGLKIFNKYYAVKILKEKEKVIGLICLDKNTKNFVFFNCPNIILATGGPAAIYYDNVYPNSQCGSTSLAICAGVKTQNLTEWQYGLSSVNPKWNVSGSYMQVLPRFVSLDKDGLEHDFIKDYFKDRYEALSKIFLKGYQWPFDSNKVFNGSSIIDLLVYIETKLKNRKVYLDYTKNPYLLKKINFKKISKEAYDYLSKTGALLDTPYKRLQKMNKPAIELYKSKGVDLSKDYLEISVCAQHHNGGISVDKWWKTNIEGLFAVGECAGTHGINRPGGSALNAGQVGSFRAASYILKDKRNVKKKNAFMKLANKELKTELDFVKSIVGINSNAKKIQNDISKDMTKFASIVRNSKDMKLLFDRTLNLVDKFRDIVEVKNKSQIIQAYKLKDVLITSSAVLCAMINYSQKNKTSRGSAIYYVKSGKKYKGMPEIFRFLPYDKKLSDKIQQVIYKNNKFNVTWRSVRPIPKQDESFENVWKNYLKDKKV